MTQTTKKDKVGRKRPEGQRIQKPNIRNYEKVSIKKQAKSDQRKKKKKKKGHKRNKE